MYDDTGCVNDNVMRDRGSNTIVLCCAMTDSDFRDGVNNIELDTGYADLNTF